MASKYDYVPTTIQELNEAFNQDVDMGSLAGLMMLNCVARPKEAKWEEEHIARENGTVKSNRVTKKSIAIEIFKEHHLKGRDFLLKMMTEKLEIHPYSATDYYRYCIENEKELLEGM